MKEVIKIDFGTLTFYDNYVIAIIDEGVNIGQKENEILIETSERFFSKPFVYITHRVNSYSVDPKIYRRVSKVNKLSGFAVVSKGYMAKSNAKIEKLFLDKPFEIFSSLDNAIDWAQKILKTNQEETNN